MSSVVQHPASPCITLIQIVFIEQEPGRFYIDWVWFFVAVNLRVKSWRKQQSDAFVPVVLQIIIYSNCRPNEYASTWKQTSARQSIDVKYLSNETNLSVSHSMDFSRLFLSSNTLSYANRILNGFFPFRFCRLIHDTMSRAARAPQGPAQTHWQTHNDDDHHQRCLIFQKYLLIHLRRLKLFSKEFYHSSSTRFITGRLISLTHKLWK